MTAGVTSMAGSGAGEAAGTLVLNVNDHVANLYVVSKMLRNAGFAVVEARNGSEALARAQAHPRPAVIVLDVRLPDISGFEICRRLKAEPQTRDIKILHTSATFVTATNKIEGLDAGADGYLTQPFEPQDLVATVRSLVRLRGVEVDLHERNEALLAADRRKDEFLAMLAHELRNPLAAVQMGLPVLGRFPPRDELEARTLEIVRRQTGLLVQLVDDLLDVSRVTRGKIELGREVLDLGALAARVCDGMRARAMAPRDQALAVSAPAAGVLVRGDANRLEQVLTNLLDNASKYSDPGTRIDVIVEADAGAGRAILSVRDAGIGIAPDALPTVFELFAQESTSLARSRGGLGIGLTLVRSLVELHGGTVTAESSGLGRGTTFRVSLPLHTGSEVAAAPRPEADVPAPRRILVVDDNDDGREMLRSLCELDGHEVTEAADGPSGVERALADRPDIAFVDIGLPGIDGYEVARRVRAKAGRPLRLVALSGYGSAEHRAEALAAGFDEHVAKPMDRARLRRCIALVK